MRDSQLASSTQFHGFGLATLRLVTRVLGLGQDGQRKLFPIRLVDFKDIRKWKRFDADTGKDLGVEIREYFIPDFSNWKDHDSFEKAFERLLRDLKSEESTVGKGP